MKSITLFTLLFLFTPMLIAQAVFNSTNTGDWSNPGSWTLVSGSDADGVPDGDDDITLLAGHTITLDVGAACSHLTLQGNSGTRLSLGNNTLEINGTLTGLGTNNSSFPNHYNIISNGSGTGGLRFIGASRTLFTSWFAFTNPTEFELEIALDPTATGTSAGTVKAENMTISSGTFQITSGNILIDQGTNGVGDLLVSNGATLSCNHLFRSNNFTTYLNSILIEGTLKVNTSTAYVNASSVTINGTLEVDNTIVSNPTSSDFVYGVNSTLAYMKHSQPVAGAEVRRMVSGNGSLIYNLLLGNTINSFKLNGKDIYIANNLHFTAGKILTGDQALHLSSGATITGYDNSKFIVIGNGSTPSNDPNAGVKQEVGSTPVFFPIGPTSGHYNPVTITNDGTVDNFLLRVDNSVTTPALPDEVVNREWHISEEVAGGSDLTLQFQFESSHTAADFDINDGLHIGHCMGSGGTPPTSCDWEAASASWSGSGTLASPWLAWASGFTELSPFGVGSGSTALPVELVEFRGEIQKNNNKITWLTVSENNTSNFQINRSSDGQHWQNIGMLPAVGFSNQRKEYIFVDTDPFGQTYYQLKITDFDKQVAYSSIVVLERTDGEVSVFPNPSNGDFTIALGENDFSDGGVYIYNAIGQLVYTQTIQNAGNNITLQLTDLPGGIYFIQLTTGGKQVFQSILIAH